MAQLLLSWINLNNSRGFLESTTRQWQGILLFLVIWIDGLFSIRLPIQRFYWCWILKSRDFETVHWSLAKIKGLSLTQDINWTQIRYSEGVQDVLWKSYLHLGMLSLLWNNLIAAVLISLEVEIWVLSIEYWTHQKNMWELPRWLGQGEEDDQFQRFNSFMTEVPII